MSKEITSNMSIKKMAKVIKLNLGYEGINEGNTVQTPFIAEYMGERITGIEYSWTAKNGKENIKRGMFVSGHGEYGVPTLRESEVLSSLQNIFASKKTKNGICELKTENILDDDLYIEYTINELAKDLGYIGHISNNIRENIKKSVEMLVASTIFNRYEGGLYDVRRKQYIKNPTLAYHYLESIEGYETIDENNGSTIDVTKIKLSRFIYDSLASNYNIFYNKNDVNKTRNLTARKLYKMVLQWSGNKDFSWAMIDTLVEKLPMKQKLDKYKKQNVRKVLGILNDKGMCKIVYDKYNEDKVYFVFKENVNIDDDINLHSKYNTFKEIQDGMRLLGFLEIEIGSLLDKNIESINYIRALLRYCEIRVKYEGIENPKRYFESYLENKYPVDEKYYSISQ